MQLNKRNAICSHSLVSLLKTSTTCYCRQLKTTYHASPLTQSTTVRNISSSSGSVTDGIIKSDIISNTTTVSNNNSNSSCGTRKGLSDSVLRSVIKFYANTSPPNFLIPWQRKQQTRISGSGFVVDVRRRLLLTNCHVVAHAPFVEIRKHGDSDMFVGVLLYLGADCDLALVCVPDDAFWVEEDEDLIAGNANSTEQKHHKILLKELDFDTTPYTPKSSMVEASKSSSSSSNAVEGSDGPPQVGLERLLNIGPFDGIPLLQSDVKVVGYPMGGDQISITSGVVSRIDMSSYNGKQELLTIQLDAAINSGNSGGPALGRCVVASTEESKTVALSTNNNINNAMNSSSHNNNSESSDRVIGVAFQTLKNADNIGYIIPIPIIAIFARAFLKAPVERLLEQRAVMERFAQGIRIKDYHKGFTTLGITVADMHNESLRRYFKMSSGETGFLISSTVPLSCAADKVLPNDVLTKVDGHTIANDGTIAFRARERLPFRHVVRSTEEGASLEICVLREGRPLQLTVYPTVETQLVPEHIFNDTFQEMPKYYIFGGLVFSPLTGGLIQEWGGDWYTNAPRPLVSAFLDGVRTPEVQEHIIVVQVLAHEVNRGYENVYGRRVVKVCDVVIKDFAHFVSLMNARTGRAQLQNKNINNNILSSTGTEKDNDNNSHMKREEQNVDKTQNGNNSSTNTSDTYNADNDDDLLPIEIHSPMTPVEFTSVIVLPITTSKKADEALMESYHIRQLAVV